LIKDWYKDARDFTEEEISLIAKEPFDENALKNEYDIEVFLNNAKGIEVKKALAGKSSCNIFGLISGYTGKETEFAKTIIPSVAIAKLDFRLIPDMVPKIQYRRLRDYLMQYHDNDNNHTDDADRRHGAGASTDIEVRFLGGEPAARTRVNNYFVNIVREAALEIYGKATLNVSSAGTGPMYYFYDVLQAPSVCIGGTNLSNKTHSPNEYMRIDLLNNTIKCIALILEKFAAKR
jgi:acetylornithine deacetylase/succinyl-diaminopimelate desuccinylase-like protein